MALNQEQQFQELINQSNHILITFRRDYSNDAVAAALALASYLNKLDKRFSLVVSDWQLPNELAFLPGVDGVQNKITNLQQFVIALDLKDKKVDEFSYDVKKNDDDKSNKLEIYVTPGQGSFDEQDVSVGSSDYRYDTIITLDTPDLESLGEIYNSNAEFFFKTIIINIDHNVVNENFGQLNLVELNASSVSEILYNLITKIDANLIDEQMATALLTGIIAKTQSFKSAKVVPATLHSASDLINKGADKDKIIQNLYRTKTLTTLKLWGRVLARLQHDKHLKFVWSAIPHSDFVKAGAGAEDIRGVVEEMISNTPQTEIILILYELAESGVGGQLYTSHNFDAKHLLNNFEVSGTKNFVSFVIAGKTLEQVEAEVVNEIRQKLERE